MWMMVMPMKISWKALKLMNCTFNSGPKKLLLKDSAKTNLETNSIKTIKNLIHDSDLQLNQQAYQYPTFNLHRAPWFKLPQSW